MSETPRFTPAQYRAVAAGVRQVQRNDDDSVAVMLDHAADVLEAQHQLELWLAARLRALKIDYDAKPVSGKRDLAIAISEIDYVLKQVAPAGEPERTP